MFKIEKMTVIYTKITVTNEKNDSHNTFITVMTLINASSANIQKSATKLTLTKWANNRIAINNQAQLKFAKENR